MTLTETNALQLSWKMMNEVMFVLLGAGASNTTYSDSQKFIVFGTKGGLHKNRVSDKEDTVNGRCVNPSNSERNNKIKNAVVGAGALVTPPFPWSKA